MSGPLERAAAFFVAPAKGAAPARAAALTPSARTVVLGGPEEVAALGAAIALEGPVPGAVALWRGARTPSAGLATRAAARLTAQLVAHDLPAIARGRLAWLALPDDPYLVTVAVRCASALVPGPFVTALAGPRPPELETLLAEHDIAVVAADPETPLARAALTGLTARGIPAAAIPPPRRGATRALALAGLAAPRLEIARAREAT
jgi:hypothetical protein